MDGRASATDFVRAARVLLLARSLDLEPGQIAEREYGKRSPVLKSAIDGVGFSTSAGQDLTTARAIARDFARAVEPLSVLGKLSGISRVPFDTPAPYISARSAAAFVAEFAPVPVVRPTLVSTLLRPRKVSAIIVTSKELLKHASSAESTLRRELTASVVEGLDGALLDPAHTATDGRPGSVTSEADVTFNGGSATDVTGIDSLLSAMLSHFAWLGGDVRYAAWITTPSNALGLSLLRVAPGGARAFEGVTVAGGMLGGLPLLVSASAPADGLTLLDSSALMLADNHDVSLLTSDAALIDMDTAPDGSNYVSVFATDSAALRVTRFLNWALIRPAVVYATNFTLAPAVVSTTA
jgi:HK97 family phage major capsid protein